MTTEANALLELRLLPIENNIAGKSTGSKTVAATPGPARDTHAYTPTPAPTEGEVKLMLRHLVSYARQVLAHAHDRT